MLSRLLVALLLLALLAGCTAQKEKAGEETGEQVQTQTQVQSYGDDAELSELMQESQEIESFLSQVEAGDSLDIEL
ncbi:MAG: hypothetical protein GXN98_01670 [Euryarchaeota archaeon]|nr:hypothetical protein [Euryarchaeota archaeon]